MRSGVDPEDLYRMGIRRSYRHLLASPFSVTYKYRSYVRHDRNESAARGAQVRSDAILPNMSQANKGQRVTLITGGSRGIGAAIAKRLAAEGHQLIITYQNNAAAAERVADEARAAGSDALCVQADMANESDIDALFALAQERYGQITGLVNNAGITGFPGKLVDQDPATIRRVFDVNCTAVMLCCRHAARQMATSLGGTGGCIVNITSGAATIGSPGEYVHYAASKAAIDAVTLGLSKELGPDGIRVNAVAPGVILTDLHAAGGQPDKAERVGRATPLGRPGEPEEIANAVAWLMSDEASYVTGAILRVAGGR